MSDSDYMDIINGKNGIYANERRLAEAGARGDTLEIVKIMREGGGLYGSGGGDGGGGDGSEQVKTTATTKAKITFLQNHNS